MRLNTRFVARALAFCAFTPVVAVFFIFGFVLGLLWDMILEGSTYAGRAIDFTIDFIQGVPND